VKYQCISNLSEIAVRFVTIDNGAFGGTHAAANLTKIAFFTDYHCLIASIGCKLLFGDQDQFNIQTDPVSAVSK